jgi:hypothetical protein
VRRTPGKRAPKPVVPYDEDAQDLVLFASGALRGILANTTFKANAEERTQLCIDVAEAAMEALSEVSDVQEDWWDAFEDAYLASVEGLLVRAELGGDTDVQIESIVKRAVAQATSFVKAAMAAMEGGGEEEGEGGD